MEGAAIHLCHFQAFPQAMTVCQWLLRMWLEWELQEHVQHKPSVSVQYCRSGNFRVIKLSCFKFSRKNTGYPQKYLMVLIDSTFQGLVIWNETAHAKKMWSTNSLRAAFVATIQLLANY